MLTRCFVVRTQLVSAGIGSNYILKCKWLIADSTILITASYPVHVPSANCPPHPNFQHLVRKANKPHLPALTSERLLYCNSPTVVARDLRTISTSVPSSSHHPTTTFRIHDIQPESPHAKQYCLNTNHLPCPSTKSTTPPPSAPPNAQRSQTV